MIANDTELEVTLKRTERLREQIVHLKRCERNPDNYRSSVSGFVAEMDRHQLDVRDYLMRVPELHVGVAS